MSGLNWFWLFWGGNWQVLKDTWNLRKNLHYRSLVPSHSAVQVQSGVFAEAERVRACCDCDSRPPGKETQNDSSGSDACDPHPSSLSTDELSRAEVSCILEGTARLKFTSDYETT